MKLDRHVAIKILPSQFTEDLAQVRRFEREARAASALNNPNIITIHEIGQEGDLHFIATEFIEGRTLRERLSEGALPVNEVIDIARQIATALSAAHAAGIIHRDIKPENVMVRPDGLVKVLDFRSGQTDRAGVGCHCGSDADGADLANRGRHADGDGFLSFAGTS